VDVEIDGKPVRALIDTGYAESAIPLHEAQKLGLPLTESTGRHWYDEIAGESQIYLTHVRLKIGPIDKSDLQLVVFGDGHAPSNFSLVLGEDFFSQVDTEFDLQHNSIRLFKPRDCSPPQLVYWGSAYSQSSLAILDDPANPELKSEAQLNGKKVWAVLDSGFATSLVDTTTADHDGVRWPSGSRAGGPTLAGLGPSSQQSRVGLFDSFVLGDERVNKLSLLVAPMNGYFHWYVPTLWLGADFFRAHRIYIDMKDRLVLFSYVGGPVFRAAEVE